MSLSEELKSSDDYKLVENFLQAMVNSTEGLYGPRLDLRSGEFRVDMTLSFNSRSSKESAVTYQAKAAENAPDKLANQLAKVIGIFDRRYGLQDTDNFFTFDLGRDAESALEELNNIAKKVKRLLAAELPTSLFLENVESSAYANLKLDPSLR